MHPLLIATYILNLYILYLVYDLLGLVVGILFSWGVYYLIKVKSKGRYGDIGQKAAIAVGHLLGAVAIMNASWGTPFLTAIAIIIELFLITIFMYVGR